MDTHMQIQLCVYLLCIIRGICFIAYLSNACRKKKQFTRFTQALKIAIPILFKYTKLYPPVFISGRSLQYSETQYGSSELERLL
jgi:hypothetical protein